jgi:hypothetical protein
MSKNFSIPAPINRDYLRAFVTAPVMVENNGVEPLTFPMQDRDAPAPMADFLYSVFQYPITSVIKMVENNGVEPLTSCVQGRRSSQLS